LSRAIIEIVALHEPSVRSWWPGSRPIEPEPWWASRRGSRGAWEHHPSATLAVRDRPRSRR